ncbi:PilZ domain-containing protein [Treponema sp.]|uniref:PilZ domain-containing protein n=1 Tax=Treponema sp. TaxID=166 RepID=UPI00298ECA86|nr:PilZ domain-containing protein [Treponema sp.]
MYIVLGITFLIVLIVVRVLKHFSDHIKFFAAGKDQKFSMSEILTLWKLARMCDLEEPISLFYSVPSLSRCITHIIEEAEEKGTQDTPQIQEFLSKLYKYRTKIELESDQKKGLDSTKGLEKGQKLRIILPGKGLFESQILNNGRELIIKLPTQKGVLKLKGDEWVDQDINIYLWRKGDANYVFDSRVLGTSVFNGQSALFITQSDKIFRAQKRRSVRCECHLPAALYIIKDALINYSTVETTPGYKCILEDISEDGAMIRIGGKGVSNTQIKIQFELEGTFILMFGIIKAVEYNAEINQSRLHFECTHVEPTMKNYILSFVYKVLPERQKEIFAALTETEQDAKDMGDSPDKDSPSATAGQGINAEDLIKISTENTDAAGVTGSAGSVPDPMDDDVDISELEEV